MTDTADTAALREKAETAKVCGGMFAISGEQALSLLDQLEAERQRADKSDAMLSECLESLKAAEKELGIRSHQLVKADASVADLEKRLRYTEETLIAVNDLLTAAEARVKDLKAKLANTVVLEYRKHDGFTDPEKVRLINAVTDRCAAAIKESGFTVKEGQ